MSSLKNCITVRDDNIVQRIIFLSPKLKSALSKNISACLKKWQSNWCFDTSDITVDIASDVPAEHSAKQHLLSYNLTQSDQVFLVSDNEISWPKLLFGNELAQVPDDDIFDKVVERAKTDFFQNLFSSITGSDTEKYTITEDPQALSVQKQRPGDGYFRCDIHFGGQYFSLGFLAINLSSKYFVSDNSGRAKPKLTAVKANQLNGVVVADVELDLGEFKVADINNLAVGDVLTSERSIYSSFELSVGQKKLVSAKLGCQGSQKAVILLDKE